MREGRLLSVMAALSAALLMAGCGEDETERASAWRIGPDGEQIAVKTVDLTVEDAVYVVDTDEPGDVEVVRRNGRRTPVPQWVAQLSASLHLKDDLHSDDGRIVVYTGVFPQWTQRDPEPEERSRDAFDRGFRYVKPCPEVCYHCPEDAADVCAQMCGFGQ